MIRFLKNLFKPKKQVIPKSEKCRHCGGELKPLRADVSEIFGKPVKMCSKCKRLTEIK